MQSNTQLPITFNRLYTLCPVSIKPIQVPAHDIFNLMCSGKPQAFVQHLPFYILFPGRNLLLEYFYHLPIMFTTEPPTIRNLVIFLLPLPRDPDEDNSLFRSQSDLLLKILWCEDIISSSVFLLRLSEAHSGRHGRIQ